MKVAIEQRVVQERYTNESIMLQYLHKPTAKLAKKSIVKQFCMNLLRVQKLAFAIHYYG
jgi:hypothetical protein